MSGRIRGEALASHPKRAELLRIISLQPGIGFRELRRQGGFSNGTLSHHLNKLEAAGLLQAVRTSRVTRYALPGRLASLKGSVIRAAGARRLYDVIRENPGISVSMAAHLSDLSLPTVRYHVRRFASQGLLSSFSAGRRKRLQLAGDGFA